MMPTNVRSLRVTIIAPFLLGLLALTIFLACYTHSSSMKALEESVRLISLSQTRNVYNSMTLFFRSMSTAVEKLTTDTHVTDLFLPEEKRGASIEEDRENWFEILIHGNAYYRSIIIVDTNGVCVASNSQMQVGVSYANRPYLRRVLEGEAFISDVRVGIRTNILTATAAAPVFINGKIVGAVIMINDFPKIVNYESTGDGGIQSLSPSLLAPDGSFIAHENKELVLSGKKFPQLYEQLRNAPQDANVRYVLNGKEYIGFARPEATTDWLVCSSGIESEVFSYASDLTRTVVMVSIIALCLISFLIIRVINGILSSFFSLISYAKQVSEGNLSLKLEKSQRNDELGVLHTSLQSLVAAMQKMVAQSQEASKLKSQFLANMSHEIRTPLNAVIGMAHLYFAAADDQQEKKHEYVSKIQVAGKSLLGLINNILDISKIEADMFELDNIPFNLKDSFEQIRVIHNDTAEMKKLRLTVEYAPDLPVFFIGDPVRIGQVLNNLTGNALKFSQKGGVTLRCEKSPETSPDTCSDGKMRLLISVQDTGIGIPEEQQDLLFKPFSQGDASITRRFGGTGLGLVISRSIVNMMGGDFSLRSESGKGTTFYFTINLELQKGLAVEDDEESLSFEKLHLEGKRILVAEDNAINQLLMEELLSATGAEVTIVEDGLQAIEAVRVQTFDLVLMDIQMPVMGGIEASREIRKFASYADLPIVAVSANAMKEDKELGAAAGLNDYITKPIDPDQLIMSLQRWLR